MRKLTILVLAVAAIYAGYWYVGATATENGATLALEDMRSNGWTVGVEELSTKGFPSRFDTTAKNLLVVSPDRSIGWSAPFVQALALSYKPNEVIIVFPDAHAFQLNGQDINLKTDGLRASAAVTAAPSAPLANLTVELTSAQARITNHLAVTIGKSLLALRPAGGDADYDAYLDLRDVELPQSLFPEQAGVSGRISQATIDATVMLDRPLDRHVSVSPRPQIGAIDLNGLTLQWGAMSIRGKGAVNVDPSGIPTGRITLNLRGWDQMIDLASVSGLIDPGLVPTAKSMARTMALGSDTLDVPLTFENGLMWAGPLPLGPAPRLR